MKGGERNLLHRPAVSVSRCGGREVLLLGVVAGVVVRAAGESRESVATLPGVTVL